MCFLQSLTATMMSGLHGAQRGEWRIYEKNKRGGVLPSMIDAALVVGWRRMVSEYFSGEGWCQNFFYLLRPLSRHSFLSFLVTGKCIICGNTYCLCMLRSQILKELRFASRGRCCECHVISPSTDIDAVIVIIGQLHFYHHVIPYCKMSNWQGRH